MFFIGKFTHKYQQASDRTKLFARQAALSFLMKGANIICSLLIVPLTIGYVNPEQYGIWLTLSSIIGWITFFDLGLGNGFRNKFTEAKAQGDEVLAREYVSTTYFSISCIVACLLPLLLLLSNVLDWSQILHISPAYNHELKRVFAIVASFVALNMVANIFSMLLSADQKPGLASIVSAVGQYVSLGVLFLLTQVSTGSLTRLALFYAGIPCLVTLITSLWMFLFGSYARYAPRWKFVRPTLVKNIFQLGGQFFLIYLCLILIFQVVNLIITRELGPMAVSQYTVANKYFNIIFMVMNTLLAPLWSAFSDAYTRKDYSWMRGMTRKIEFTFLGCCLASLLLLVASPLFFRIWVGDEVSIPVGLSVAMMCLTVSQMFGNMYMYMINGTGYVRIQLITYVLFAALAWPLFLFSARLWGLVGICLIPILVYITQGVLGKIQISRITNGTAYGIWCK